MGLTPDSVLVVRNGTPGAPDDRIVVTALGLHFHWFTPGFAGKRTGRLIVITAPVEN